jgi:hypothetical protein
MSDPNSDTGSDIPAWGFPNRNASAAVAISYRGSILWSFLRLKLSGEHLTVSELSREEARRLLVELADLLGYYPASVASEDVSTYRKGAAERRVEAPHRG